MPKPKYYYIKERDNRNSIYFLAMGQISMAKVRSEENPIHGVNTMHRFMSEVEYLSKIEKLKSEGAKFIK